VIVTDGSIGAADFAVDSTGTRSAGNPETPASVVFTRAGAVFTGAFSDDASTLATSSRSDDWPTVSTAAATTAHVAATAITRAFVAHEERLMSETTEVFFDRIARVDLFAFVSRAEIRFSEIF
jgi:hypothetical protein